jgi:hypothetical protein
MRDNESNPLRDAALVDAKAMAKMASVTPRQIGQLRALGIIPAVRLGWKTIRYNPARVLEALETGEAAKHMADLVERQKARSAARKANQSGGRN